MEELKINFAVGDIECTPFYRGVVQGINRIDKSTVGMFREEFLSNGSIVKRLSVLTRDVGEFIS